MTTNGAAEWIGRQRRVRVRRAAARYSVRKGTGPFGMLAPLPPRRSDQSDGGTGSQAPREERYVTIRRELERAVGAVCPGWLGDRREDVVQNAMMKVLQLDRRSGGPRDLAASYLWKVAYSAAVDEMRRSGSRPELSLAGVPDARPVGESPAPGPEATAAGRELGSAIRRCLTSLVRARRHAVTLYLYGHSVPDAARLLGWSRKRVENLVFRGLADLRRCLAARGFAP